MDDIYIVHQDVPISTAAQLGVPSLTSHMLSGAETFAEWGQEEPLTRRLQMLLKDGYVDGFSFAKELFQNADDARARKLYLLYDERENMDARSQLLNEGMSECQGPAVWVYNDAQFSCEDLENIKHLSGATKKDDATKIGKFGLGFCAVYNITDVPSFISGSNFVIFDPHTTFLGNALPGKSPGLRINLNRILMKRLRNQLKPFEGVFGCSLLNCEPHFEGTLFRLPLRSRRSEISGTIYQPTEVKELFAKIMKMSANMLIFNQSVQEMKIFHFPKSEGNPVNSTLLFEIFKTNVQLAPCVNSAFKSNIVVETAERKSKETLLDNPIRILEKVTISGEKYCDENFQVCGRRENITGIWFVGWSTCASERTMKLAYTEKGTLPLGAVALPVEYNTLSNNGQCFLEFLSLEDVQRDFYQTGHLFFFLPLPIEHRFPFHVNSQFTVTSDRRQLKTSTEDDKNIQMKDLNKCLLQDSVTQALLFLLEKVHEVENIKNYRFYRFWPRPETSLLMQTLTHSFYEQVLISKKFKVFEKNGIWFDISECVFIETGFRSSEVGEIAFEFLSHLVTHVLDLPQDICKMLIQADERLIKEKTVDETHFFLDYFLPNLHRFKADALMINKRNTLLCHAVCLRYDVLDCWLKENPSIPTRPNGSLKRPVDIVDPHSKIAELFEAADEVFPEKILEDISPMQSLHKLGMMFAILTDGLVLERASSVVEKYKQCSTFAFEMSGHLLLYLSENIVNHHNIIERIQLIEFIPVKTIPDYWPFKWKADEIPPKENDIRCSKHSLVSSQLKAIHFCCPVHLYHRNCSRIIGSLRCIFAEAVLNCTEAMLKYSGRDINEMLQKIGMKGIPHQKVDYCLVVKQLEIIAHSWNSGPLPLYSHEVKKSVIDIYKYLDCACQSVDVSENTRALLQNKAVVWISDVFVHPKIVATYEFYRDCKPYFYNLCESPMKRFEVLTKCIGINQYLKPYDIAFTLQSVQIEKGNKSLSWKEIRKVIGLLHNLYESMQSCDMKDVSCLLDDKLKAIYGPDDEDFLRDLTVMCFNDNAELEKSESMIYCSGFIPIELAKVFGVKSKLMHNLEEEAEDFEEDFSQDEPLVNRLKRLVEGYPFDSGVFKELIQNADDAQATEIHFLKDYATHPIRNVMNNNFEPLQGPALCIFNNSAFSEVDLTWIKVLGVGSKSEDPSRTGRYGVGFNSVYNLTDVPSFYTRGKDIVNGETLCFFDPLARYLPNLKNKSKGKRYKNVEKAVRSHHDNVMCGYHEDFFMQQQGIGTVFRLPLRTDEMAHVSEIKKESTSMSYVSELLNSFSNESKDVLLFLKNLKTIKFSTHTITGYSEEICINVQLTQNDTNKRKKFAEDKTKICRSLKSKEQSIFDIQQNSVVYEFLVTDTRKCKTAQIHCQCIVVQTFGFKNMDKIPDVVKKKHNSGELSFLPHGGVALFRENSITWDDNVSTDSSKSKAYCFLPLLVYTGLPVNVHGYFALDNETRRGLWRSEDKEGNCHRTLWNLTLIEQVIAPSYVLFLEYAKTKLFESYKDKTVIYSSVVKSLQNYQKLFPLKSNTSEYYWEHLLKCTYRELVSDNICFLPVLETAWISQSLHYKCLTRTTVLSWTPLRKKEILVSSV